MPDMNFHNAAHETGQTTPGQLASARIWVTILLVLYLATIAYMYKQVFAPLYAYLGMVIGNHDLSILLISCSLALIPGFFLSLRIERPSTFILWLLYLLVLIPGAIVPMIALVHPWDYLPYVLAMVGSFLLMTLVPSLKLIRIPRPKIDHDLLLVCIVVITLAIDLLAVFKLGFHGWSITSLASFYEVRETYAKNLKNSSHLFAYIFSWLDHCLHPFLIAVGLYQRRRMLVATGIAGQLILVSVSGFKTTLLAIPIILGVYAFVKYGFLKRITPVLLSLVALCWISWLLDVTIVGSPWYSSIMVRRGLLLPGFLSGAYFDFFSQHGLLYYSQGILSSVTPVILRDPVARVIAANYLHSNGASANANFWADAFANFGYIGMVAISLLFALYLWVLDSVALGLPKAFVLAFVLVALLPVVNSSLLTGLLTHGGLLSLLLVYLSQEYSVKRV